MPWKILFSKKISLLHLLLAVAVTGLSVYFITKKSIPDSMIVSPTVTNTKIEIVRDRSYRYTRPLRYFDLTKQSRALKSLKNKLQEQIVSNKESGQLFQASVYIRDLENGEWTTINEQDTYHPGSLIKVPMMIYYLKEAEKNKSILEHKLTMPTSVNGIPSHTFKNNAVDPGKSYSINELLKFMVCNSDNNATFLLNNYCNIPDFQKVFTDLGLSKPDVHDTNYAISIRDYSVFMRVLYNATYLSPEMSDYALKLLSESTFSMGISNKLPHDIAVARKFGEFKKDNKRELHECGIVYCNNKPYMLAIMTKGYNPQNLANFIASLSECIFNHFCTS